MRPPGVKQYFVHTAKFGQFAVEMSEQIAWGLGGRVAVPILNVGVFAEPTVPRFVVVPRFEVEVGVQRPFGVGYAESNGNAEIGDLTVIAESFAVGKFVAVPRFASGPRFGEVPRFAVLQFAVLRT